MSFDIKGSVDQRYTKIGSNNKFWKLTHNFNKILKDQNIMEINNDIDWLFI